MQLEVYNVQKGKVSTLAVEVPADAKLNKALLYFALKAQLNNKRHGTVRTKTRGEVHRTKKKLFKQKGTGNARHGARSANIFVGGGNVFGPLPRSYFEYMNKTAKKAAYKEVLTHIVAEGALKLVDKFSFDKPSTKSAVEFLEKNNFLKKEGKGSTVVVLNAVDANAELSFRNIRDVKVIHENNLNLIDLVNYDSVLMAKDHFNVLKERYGV